MVTAETMNNIMEAALEGYREARENSDGRDVGPKAFFEQLIDWDAFMEVNSELTADVAASVILSGCDPRVMYVQLSSLFGTAFDWGFRCARSLYETDPLSTVTDEESS